MWTRIANVLSNKKVMLRLAFTLVLVFIFRLVSHIAVPLFNTSAITALIEQEGSFLAIINNFTGGGLERFSILALGISPYITASIVMQLLQMVLPSVKEWAEQGEEGKQKMNRITRYLAMGLAFVQGLALILGADQGTGAALAISINPNTPFIFYYLYMSLTIAAGTAFAIWIADLITKKGIGNGTSILIVVGIVTSLPKMIAALNSKYLGAQFNGVNLLLFIIIMLLFVGILLGVVYLQIATRKIPIQYANRQGKSDSHIPMKLNAAGVIPVIFASTIMSVPLTIVGLIGGEGSGAAAWIQQIFDSQRPIGFIVYIILIVFFSFFYSFMQVDPEKIADNLSKSNSYIPGVRPGDATKDFVARLLFKITVIGTVYLVLLAITPIITSLVFGFTAAEASLIQIGGTSLLIVVGVATETTQQIETDADNTTYSGIFG